jgi:hypothetical protein
MTDIVFMEGFNTLLFVGGAIVVLLLFLGACLIYRKAGDNNIESSEKTSSIIQLLKIGIGFGIFLFLLILFS